MIVVTLQEDLRAFLSSEMAMRGINIQGILEFGIPNREILCG
jgi:hypothetical protein